MSRARIEGDPSGAGALDRRSPGSRVDSKRLMKAEIYVTGCKGLGTSRMVDVIAVLYEMRAWTDQHLDMEDHGSFFRWTIYKRSFGTPIRSS
jgi:hypothetical protein